MTPYALFMANVNESEGPLLDLEDEAAQEEFDRVCGKLYQYVVKEKEALRE